MSRTLSQGQRNVVAREIGGWRRTALAAVGLMSWLAGGAASFLSKNGAGAAALVAAGTVCGVLALMDRWPSRISMSGNEFSWDDIKETVDSQIEVAENSGEASDALRELKELRERLDVLQRTGSVPEHPAETYDKNVSAALQRLLPGAEIIRQGTGRNDIADFVVRHQGDRLLVETKWRADPARPFGGTTLPRLTQNLSPDDKLLVVVNTDQWRPNATRNVEDVLGDRGRCLREGAPRRPQKGCPTGLLEWRHSSIAEHYPACRRDRKNCHSVPLAYEPGCSAFANDARHSHRHECALRP